MEEVAAVVVEVHPDMMIEAMVVAEDEVVGAAVMAGVDPAAVRSIPMMNATSVEDVVTMPTTVDAREAAAVVAGTDRGHVTEVDGGLEVAAGPAVDTGVRVHQEDHPEVVLVQETRFSGKG